MMGPALGLHVLRCPCTHTNDQTGRWRIEVWHFIRRELCDHPGDFCITFKSEHLNLVLAESPEFLHQHRRQHILLYTHKSISLSTYLVRHVRCDPWITQSVWSFSTDMPFRHAVRRAVLRAVSSPLTYSAQRSFAKISLQRTRISEPQSLLKSLATQLRVSSCRTYATEQAQPDQEQDSSEEQLGDEPDKPSDKSASELISEKVTGFTREVGERAEDATAAITPDSPTSSAQPTPIRSESDPAEPKERESSKIYLGNLYFEVNAERLKKELENFGELLDVRVTYDARGLSKGFVRTHLC